MVAAAGAGPAPIHSTSINSQNLAEAIQFCLRPDAIRAAKEISTRMQTESGVKAAVRSFHANLPLATLQCDLVPDQPASWVYKEGQTWCKISNLAANILVEASKISPKRLRL